MKAALIFTAHSFLLFFAFIAKLPLTLSSDDEVEVEQVVDVNGNPIFPGGHYYILPAIFGPAGSGGLKLSITGDSTCPVTVLQDYLQVNNGLPLKFSVPGISPGVIFTGTEMDIEFLEKPNCAESSKWLVFVDYDIPSPKACVGIGGSENYPGKKTVSGKFHIQKYKLNYKLVFCVSDSTTCLDIGRSNGDENESGKRLNLTHQEPYQIVFVDASAVSTGIRSSAV